VWGEFVRSLLKYRILLSLFLVGVILSAGSLVYATSNYLEFYVALGTLHLDVDSFNVSIVYFGEVKGVSLDAVFGLGHNSSYSGLRLNSAYLSMFYEDEAEPLFEVRVWLEGVVLPPFSTVPIVIENLNVTYNVMRFIELVESGKVIHATLKSCVYLYIFCDPFATTLFLDDVELTLEF
jgi:hypothetical protein